MGFRPLCVHDPLKGGFFIAALIRRQLEKPANVRVFCVYGRYFLGLTMQENIKLMKRQEVEAKVTLGCSAIYARMDSKSQYYDATFPRPIQLGSGKNPPVAWIESELDAWIAAQIETTRSKVA